jgi:hypothetical protein
LEQTQCLIQFATTMEYSSKVSGGIRLFPLVVVLIGQLDHLLVICAGSIILPLALVHQTELEQRFAGAKCVTCGLTMLERLLKIVLRRIPILIAAVEGSEIVCLSNQVQCDS